MIRYAKILETDGQQLLIRACHHPALAGIPQLNEDEFNALLTIDTEFASDDPDKPQLARMVLNLQLPLWQQLAFDAVDEAFCLQVLQTLRLEQLGLLTREDILNATDRLQSMLREHVKSMSDMR